MEYQDYYQTLGVTNDVSADELKKQYRRLARKYHPDVSKEPNAEAQFKAVKEAYEVLKDPEKRRAYDQLGQQWQRGQSGFEPPPDWAYQSQRSQTHQPHTNEADFSDFFDSLFGQGHHSTHQAQQGDDIHSKVTISLNQAFHGCELTLTLNDVQLNPKTQQLERKPKQLRVKIPAGVQENQQIRLAGQGRSNPYGGQPGNLLLEIHIEPHRLYTLSGKDILLTVPITPWEAALGARIQVPTLSGQVNVNIPANSQNGNKLRLKGKGLPSKAPGDQLITLSIETPAANTDEQKQLYESMARSFEFNPRQSLIGD